MSESIAKFLEGDESQRVAAERDYALGQLGLSLEIEAELRAENAELNRVLGKRLSEVGELGLVGLREHANIVGKLEAENAKLREALNKVDAISGPYRDGQGSALDLIAKIARAALGK